MYSESMKNSSFLYIHTNSDLTMFLGLQSCVSPWYNKVVLALGKLVLSYSENLNYKAEHRKVTISRITFKEQTDKQEPASPLLRQTGTPAGQLLSTKEDVSKEEIFPPLEKNSFQSDQTQDFMFYHYTYNPRPKNAPFSLWRITC